MKILSAGTEDGKGSLLNTSKLEYLFILTICLVTTFLILIFAHPNSLAFIDECRFLCLGKCIVDGSDYYFGFPDGRPIIPSIIAFFLYLGFDIVAVRLLIPLIFMNSTLISTYALGKTLFGRKEAIIATLFLFTFPFFWGFGNTTLVDIPLITFTTLFLLFFYLGIEKNVKFLPISSIFISVSLLIKMNAILFLVSAFFYLIIRKKWDICRKKEFIISAMIIPLSFLSIYTLFHVSMSANISFSNIGSAANVPFLFFEILRLGLAPILVLMVLGISKERRSIYLLLPILTFFVFWAITGRFFALRHFAPLFPIVGILIAVGFFKLLNKYNKKFVCILLIVLLAVSFVHAVYLQDYHKESHWGVQMLSTSVNELEGNGKVAIDHSTIGYYLQASTDKDIIDAFKLPEEYPWILQYDIITDEWIHKNKINYIVLSIYGEQYRTKFEDCIHPKFLMIEVPFIKFCQYGQLPQSERQFKSDLYNMCEKNYEKVDVICKNKQKVFIIYKA
jgi:hypothetical protein